MSRAYAAAAAARYEAEVSHALPPGEALAWRLALRSCIGGPAGRRVLDVGSGTGLLLDVLVRAGVHVQGLEPSSAMIGVARRRRRVLRGVPVRRGDASDGKAFRPGAFDAIVSRQVLCHLTDVDAVFATWRRWLRPGGVLVLVDGLWPAEAWSAAQRAAQPFASLTNAAPVAVALRRAGFGVSLAGRWHAGEAARRGALRPDRSPRYVVIALSSWSAVDGLALAT